VADTVIEAPLSITKSGTQDVARAIEMKTPIWSGENFVGSFDVCFTKTK
jgi:hypothetical protein